MSLKKKLEALSQQGSDRLDSPVNESWRPRLELDDKGGFFVSTPRKAVDNVEAAELLAEFDLSAENWDVTNVRRSKWQSANGEWLESYRVSLKPKGSIDGELSSDTDRLIEEIRKWRPSTRIKAESRGESTFIFAVGDTQYGKDASDGTDEIIARVLGGYDSGVTRFRELQKLGRGSSTICLPQLGDCIEGNSSQGGKLLARSDLGVTAQVRVGRRMLIQQIKAFAPLASDLIVPVVPGNHDEPHRIVITDPIDSWQIDIVAAAEDACRENPALDHVQFRYPERDHQTLAVDLSGTLVGFAHGHQSRDAVKWWQGQSVGRTPVGEADVLITAHFHHFQAKQVGPRLWLQVPASDGGSPWWRDKSGLESPTGFVSLTVGAGIDPRQDLSVLSGLH